MVLHAIRVKCQIAQPAEADIAITMHTILVP
jgi:hypothetical protein